MFEYLITRPLGFIIRSIYHFIPNYGVAIILFTVIIKLLLLPLQFKSQKAMKKQQMIQPLLAELQQKYANDKEKLQTEMLKLYKENDVSMTGGCMPLLIQMPILFGLYRVIQRPITYIAKVDFKADDVIEKVTAIVNEMFEKVPSAVASLMNSEPAKMVSDIAERYQIQLSTWCKYLYGNAHEWVINFKFLGLDLSKVPTASYSAIFKGNFDDMSVILLILIPLVAVITTWLSMKYSQKLSGQRTQKNSSGAEENPAEAMNKSMNIMMPVMTLVFTSTLPSGMGLYWIISNIMQMGQQFILSFYFDKKEDDFVVKIPESNRKNSKKRK